MELLVRVLPLVFVALTFTTFSHCLPKNVVLQETNQGLEEFDDILPNEEQRNLEENLLLQEVKHVPVEFGDILPIAEQEKSDAPTSQKEEEFDDILPSESFGDVLPNEEQENSEENPKPEPPSSKKVGTDTVMCLLCVVVMGDMKKEMDDPEMEPNMEKALENGMCPFLPETMQCHERVQTYGPLVFDMVRERMDPESFCQDMKLCADPVPPTEMISDATVSQSTDNVIDAPPTETETESTDSDIFQSPLNERLSVVVSAYLCRQHGACSPEIQTRLAEILEPVLRKYPDVAAEARREDNSLRFIPAPLGY